MPKKIKKSKGKIAKKTFKKIQPKSAFNEAAFVELIKRGKAKRFVTDTEILYYFPNIEENLSALEEIYDRLEKANIKVIETAQLIEIPSEEVSEKELMEAGAIDEHVPDAVQM